MLKVALETFLSQDIPLTAHPECEPCLTWHSISWVLELQYHFNKLALKADQHITTPIKKQSAFAFVLHIEGCPSCPNTLNPDVTFLAEKRKPYSTADFAYMLLSLVYARGPHTAAQLNSHAVASKVLLPISV